jgi:hypothetical protein
VPVVDANLIVDLVAPGVPVGGAAERLVERLVAGAAVLGPALVLLQSSNALLTGIRRGRWDGAAADTAFAQLAQIPIAVADGPDDWQRAFELARRYDNWPVYDMVYVGRALRRQASGPGERLERISQDLSDQRERGALRGLGSAVAAAAAQAARTVTRAASSASVGSPRTTSRNAAALGPPLGGLGSDVE